MTTGITAAPASERRTVDTRAAAAARRLVARGQLPVRRARSTCWTTRCCASRCAPEHVKPRLLGHWGTTPGLTLLWAHLNRAIVDRDLNTIYVTGPGHGGPGVVATPSWRAPTASSTRRSPRTSEGMRQLFRQFSFPGGIPSHAAPETPGSIHEGGELGYSLMHAYGAAFDNPDLLVACVIGDGEAETGPLAASLALEQVPRPGRRRRGAADPAPQRLQDRQPDRARPDPRDGAAGRCMRGYGYQPYVVEAGLDDDHLEVHARMASTMDEMLDRIAEIQRRARTGAHTDRPQLADDRAAHAEGLDRPAGGGRRAGGGHVPGAPGAAGRAAAESRAPGPAGGSGCARTGRRSCSTPTARLLPEIAAIAPTGQRRMSDNPHANGGLLLRDLRLPDFRDYAVEVAAPGRGAGRGDQGARHLAAGRDPAQPDDVPADGPGRDRLQPAQRRVRGDRPGLRGRDPRPATTTWRRAAG